MLMVLYYIIDDYSMEYFCRNFYFTYEAGALRGLTSNGVPFRRGGCKTTHASRANMILSHELGFKPVRVEST